MLHADAAWRLGPRACALFAWHRLRLRAGVIARSLGDIVLPSGRLLPDAMPGDRLAGDAAALAAAAEAAVATGWHGPFPADTLAADLDLFTPGDIRPVWEANRLLALPLLALAARCAPADGHLERAEVLLADWRAANPPFRGPAWACGQEAALRALHLCLALALLEVDRAPPPAMRALLAAHARRIAATRAYAAAQDNNHAISEPAGLFVLGLVLNDRRMARHAARDLVRAVAWLVAPDGSFAQASPGYHRLLLDTLSLAEWFRRRHGAPPFDPPFASRTAAATAWLARVMEPGSGALPRCGATDDSHLADLTLHGAADARGSVGRAISLFAAEQNDGGSVAELISAGAHAREEELEGLSRSGTPRQGLPDDRDRPAEEDRRGSAPPNHPAKCLEHLERSYLVSGTGVAPLPLKWATGARAGFGAFPGYGAPRQISAFKGSVADGLPSTLPATSMGSPDGEACRGQAPPTPPQKPQNGLAAAEPVPWHSEGWFGVHNARFRLLLRTGAPLRFRPSQADLLHLDLTLDGQPLLIDGGTGAYNPPPDDAWWTDALAGTAGHNTIEFDSQEQMPRIGRFLFARWPACRALPDGGALRDHRGRAHQRRIRLSPTAVTIEEQVGGPFARLVLRWRLAPGAWDLTTTGVSGPRARIVVTADVPHGIRLAQGWHSPAYGRVEPAPVLEMTAAAPVTRLVTRVEA
ncbi:heparinase II/III domain-containing protein [Neoroseomonas alba]|uniref:heparinase II/III domain-containing protein n=1 Tax=Roseomonas alba TaxID=2846776 RepID=UPI0021042675|nr:heparinase II/III family protein [Neoroseomonas alba]